MNKVMYTWRLFKSCALGSLNHEIACCIGAAWSTSTVGRYSGYCKNRAAGDVTLGQKSITSSKASNVEMAQNVTKKRVYLFTPHAFNLCTKKKNFVIFFGESNIFRHFASDRQNQTRTDIYMHNAAHIHHQHLGIKQYFGQRCARCMLV